MLAVLDGASVGKQNPPFAIIIPSKVDSSKLSSLVKRLEEVLNKFQLEFGDKIQEFSNLQEGETLPDLEES